MTCESSYLLLRRAVVLICVIIFLWQTAESLAKFLDRSTTFTAESLRQTERPFPGVSICQTFSVIKMYTHQDPALERNGNARELTFEEELERAKPDFQVSYRHGGVTNGTYIKSVDDEGNFADYWSSTVTVTATLGSDVISCLTYTAPGTFENGMKSIVSLQIRSPSQRSTHLFVHPPGDNLLLGNRVQGREIRVLNPITLPFNYRVEMYEVGVAAERVHGRNDLPCHDEDDEAPSMQRCLEDFAEKKGKCALPWRLQNESLFDEICQSSEHFRSVYEMYLASSEEEVYDISGCYKTCLFNRYSLLPVFSESSSDPDYIKDTNLQDVMLYLAPGGVNLQEEVLVYDLLDLVGNVGGFLGLLLGASLLSLMDSGKDLVTRLCNNRQK